MESNMEAPKETKNRPAIQSSNITPGHIYPKECVPGCNRAMCTPMFIAALFTMAKFWKQPRCPITDEWIKEMCHIYTMKFCYLQLNGWNLRSSCYAK
jgi:hypothetical protein